MKLVLRENVDHLGRRGEVVRVADGYGRNYLLPKGLAYPATPGTIKQVQAESRKRALQEAREKEHAELLAKRIEAIGTLRFPKKVGEDDTLYGSVTTLEITEALRGRGVEIERRNLLLPGPIKKAGEHAVTVRLPHEVTAEVHIDVVPEE